MKIAASLIASVLASVVVARPRPLDEGDVLPETSRITAFVIDEKGNPSVECWEISSIASASHVMRKDGSKATAQALQLATSRDLEGVDILTWPASSPIWPPTTKNSVHSEAFDFGNTFNLFSVQGGLINFNFYAARFGSTSGDDDDDEVETHIFNLENGDDWFYFEDGSSSSMARNAPAPFSMSTLSATETELIRLRYSSQPRHKVIHKGACKFTGIHTPSEDSIHGDENTSEHSSMTVQVNIKESL